MSDNANRFAAWCSPHQCHPDECFDQHHPEMLVINGAETAEQLRERLAKLHEEKQNALGPDQ